MHRENDIDNLIYDVKNHVISWRRYLHKYPELSFQEKDTAQFVWETLNTFPDMEVSRPTKTSIVAKLKGDKPGKVLAMRAEMDGLPIEEQNDFSFSSRNPGIMHACGHDGHTAMLLGAANVLSHIQDQWKGEIRFVFQHAEEYPPGGATEMVKAGVLDHVDQIIGLHLSSHLPKGKIGLAYGVLSANLDIFNIKIGGGGGHPSIPSTTIDPILIGSEITTNLQHIISRNISPDAKAVVSVTNFAGGETALNITPETIEMKGIIKTFDESIRLSIFDLMESIVKGITEAHSATYQIQFEHGYSSIINNPEITAKVEWTILNALDQSFIQLLEEKAMMASEDFSAFLETVPGCFLLLGGRNKYKNIIYPHHHPKFTFDEEALEHGLRLLSYIPFYLNE